MATTQVALVLIATTLVSLIVFSWAVIYYVPQILDGDDHGGETRPDAGRPS